MKNLTILLLLSLVCVIYSCVSEKKKKTEPPKLEEYGYAIIVEKDGSRKPGVALKAIKNDSLVWSPELGRFYFYYMDSIFGAFRDFVPAGDTVKKNMLMLIGKDSVLDFKSSAGLDSIMKKRK